MKNKKENYQSVFEKKIQLDQETQNKLKDFAPQMEKIKKEPVQESEFSRTVVCGPQEFGETKHKLIKAKKN